MGFKNGIDGQNYGVWGEDLGVKLRGEIERWNYGEGLRDEIEEWDLEVELRGGIERWN